MFRGAPTDDVPFVSTDKKTGALSRTIGQIETTIGSVIVLRGDAAVQINVADAVCRGDVIETGADSAARIAFSDGTVLELSADARLVLNEFVCEPNRTSNSALFSLIRGAFAFIAGELAKAGRFRIETPFASNRTRSEGSGIGILSLAALAFSETNEAQAKVLPVPDDDAITYGDLDHGVFDIIRNGVVISQAIDPGKTYVVDSSGNVTEILNSDSRMADLYTQQAVARSIQAMGQGPTGVGANGSSTSGAELLQVQPINFFVPTINVGAQQVLTLTAPPSSGVLPPPLTPPPTIAINNIAAAQIGVAGVSVINASTAGAGFVIGGTVSGAEG